MSGGVTGSVKNPLTLHLGRYDEAGVLRLVVRRTALNTTVRPELGEHLATAGPNSPGSGDSGPDDCRGVDPADPALGAGQADAEPFHPTEPAFPLSFADPVQEVEPESTWLARMQARSNCSRPPPIRVLAYRTDRPHRSSTGPMRR